MGELKLSCKMLTPSEAKAALKLESFDEQQVKRFRKSLGKRITAAFEELIWQMSVPGQSIVHIEKTYS